MTLPRAEAERLVREGADALRRGDGAGARVALERAMTAGDGFPPPWLMLAQACQLVGDDAAEAEALDAMLAIEPRNLPALLMRGALKARLGDDRGATILYQAALNTSAITTSVPLALAPLLADAQAFLGDAASRFEAHLGDTLATAGLSTQPPRIRQSLDLLLGKTEIYHQQPNSFYFPGLPQRQYYERDEFDWLEEIEAATPALRDELSAVLAEGREFAPYIARIPGQPRPANHLFEDPSWGAFYFWKSGVRIAENAARAPRTMAALEAAPIPVIAERSPMALWSLLKPGTHIAPHHGMLNTRLICHLPLLVPDGCAIRVGNETRAWEEGKALIFDDSFEHEAWNEGPSTRVVLLFEIWRPELSAEERGALTTIFEAINAYSGAPQEAA